MEAPHAGPIKTEMLSPCPEQQPGSLGDVEDMGLEAYISTRMDEYRQLLVQSWNESVAQPLSVPSQGGSQPGTPALELKSVFSAARLEQVPPTPHVPGPSASSWHSASLPPNGADERTPPPRNLPATPSPGVAGGGSAAPPRFATPPLVLARPSAANAANINSANYKKEYNDLMRACTGKRRPCHRLVAPLWC